MTPLCSSGCRFGFGARRSSPGQAGTTSKVRARSTSLCHAAQPVFVPRDVGRQAKDQDEVSYNHLSDDDLERMCLGTIDVDELARLIEHVLSCAECAERLEETRDYIHAMQRALATLTEDWPDSEEAN